MFSRTPRRNRAKSLGKQAVGQAVACVTEPLERRVLLSGSGQIFIANTGGTIGEYTTSGATLKASLVSGLDFPDGIAVSGSDLFVVDYDSDKIGEYTTSGATVNASLVSGLNGPIGIAVSGSDLFVVNAVSDTIGEYTTSGATLNASLVSGLHDPQYIAVSGSDLFVANYSSGTIGEYTTSGATLNASLVSGLDGPSGIAVTTSEPTIVSTAPDPTFGNAGSVTTSVNATQAYVESNGDPVVVGTSGNNGFAIQAFSTTGVSQFLSTAPIDGLATSVAENPNNDDLLLCGYAAGPHRSDVLACAVFNSSGAIDTTTPFGSSGIATGPTVATDGGNLVFIDAIQTNGQILVADQLGTEFSLSEYNSNLTLDTGFGNNGNVTTSFSKHYSSFANSIAIQSNGQILVAGIGGDNINLALYNTNGSLDTSFGSGGIVTTSISGLTNVSDVVVNTNGQIDVLGYTGSGETVSPVIAQYNTNGTLDTTFGSGGIETGSLLVARFDVVSPDSSSSSPISYLVLNAEGEIFDASQTNLTELYGISDLAVSTTEIFGLAFKGNSALPPDDYIGVANVTFTLLKVKSRKKVAKTGPTITTNSDGQFVFTGIAAATYQVKQTAQPKKYNLASPASGYYTVSIGTGQQLGNYYAEEKTKKRGADIARGDFVARVAPPNSAAVFATQGLISGDVFDASSSGLLADNKSEQVYS